LVQNTPQFSSSFEQSLLCSSESVEDIQLDGSKKKTNSLFMDELLRNTNTKLLNAAAEREGSSSPSATSRSLMKWGYNSPLKDLDTIRNRKSPPPATTTTTILSTTAAEILDNNLSRHANEIMAAWNNTIPLVHHRHFNLDLLRNHRSTQKCVTARECHGCGALFGRASTKWRHFCRICDETFCGECAPFKIRLAPADVIVRVCSLCFKNSMLSAAFHRLRFVCQPDISEDLKVLHAVMREEELTNLRYKKLTREIYDDFMTMRVMLQGSQIWNQFDESAIKGKIDPYDVDYTIGSPIRDEKLENLSYAAVSSLVYDITVLMKELLKLGDLSIQSSDRLKLELNTTKEYNVHLIRQIQEQKRNFEVLENKYYLSIRQLEGGASYTDPKVSVSGISETIDITNMKLISEDSLSFSDDTDMDVEELRNALANMRYSYSCLKSRYSTASNQLAKMSTSDTPHLSVESPTSPFGSSRWELPLPMVLRENLTKEDGSNKSPNPSLSGDGGIFSKSGSHLNIDKDINLDSYNAGDQKLHWALVNDGERMSSSLAESLRNDLFTYRSRLSSMGLDGLTDREEQDLQSLGVDSVKGILPLKKEDVLHILNILKKNNAEAQNEAYSSWDYFRMNLWDEEVEKSKFFGAMSSTDHLKTRPATPAQSSNNKNGNPSRKYNNKLHATISRSESHKRVEFKEEKRSSSPEISSKDKRKRVGKKKHRQEQQNTLG